MPFALYLTMGALFITAPLIAEATPTRIESLCEEVAYTVNESVTYGTLTQEEADKISNRCYQLYS